MPQAASDPRPSEGNRVPNDGSARDWVVRDIVRGLYDGRYEPGQRLQESQLTATYGLSRGPVREALNALTAIGIVELAPQRGAQVRVLRISEAIDTLVVAQTLLGLSARLAALQTGQSAGRERLEHCLKVVLSFASDSGQAELAIARDSFYGAITAMAGNSELSRILPTVRVHLIRVQFRSVLQTDFAQWRNDYRKIASAILAGQAKQAEAAIQAHLGRAIASLRAFQES